MTRTRSEDDLGRILDDKSVGRGIIDWSSNPGSNPRPDIKILDRRFKYSAKSCRCMAGYLKFR